MRCELMGGECGCCSHWQLGGGVLDGLGHVVERRRLVGGGVADSILAAQQQQRGQRGRAICRGDSTGRRCNHAYNGLGLHGAAPDVATNSGPSELVSVAGAQCVAVARAECLAFTISQQCITLCGAERRSIHGAVAGSQCITLYGAERRSIHGAVAGSQCIAL